jgi:hypothetical protein
MRSKPGSSVEAVLDPGAGAFDGDGVGVVDGGQALCQDGGVDQGGAEEGVGEVEVLVSAG